MPEEKDLPAEAGDPFKNATKTVLPTGETIFEVPLKDLVMEDISDKAVSARANAFIQGSRLVGDRKKVQQVLEGKVVKRIGQKGKFLVDRLFELATGVYIMREDAKGGIKYYSQPPNLSAIIYLLDRALGKPASKMEIIEEKEGIKVIESMIKDLARGTVEHTRTIEVVK